jgi:L-threonylcarbamoyladenylate synthase
LNSTSPWHLREAAHRVRSGGVIAYPTEAVFGLGCDPADEDAVRRILRIKGRDAAKGLILIASDLEQLLPYIGVLPPGRERQILASWPGPVTWIVPVRADVPAWLSGGRQTLAVRVTAHPVAAALCRACAGALVSTSANRSGHAPARTALQLRLRLGAAVDYLVPGRVGTQAKPTRILDARSGALIRA